MIAAVDSSVYYQGKYWNDLEQVRSHLNSIATGDPHTTWYQHLKSISGKPYRKALVLNCGNGWVERDLLRTGVVEEAVGIDISEDLLQKAIQDAEKDQLRARYFLVDVNLAEFPETGFDLVVNHAACHHIAYLDRVLRKICQILPEDGCFVSWDYIGPHRNQYPAGMWEAMWRENELLPVDYRKQMHYPHLPTMLATDPTEAIHSELFLETLRRYFLIPYQRYLGGAIAYELLCFNPFFFETARDPNMFVRQLLDADKAFCDISPEENSLFMYSIATPNKLALLDRAALLTWTHEEEVRERSAIQESGRYYPKTLLESLYYG